MKIMGTGIDYSTGDLLVQPMEEGVFGQKVQDALGANAGEVRSASRTSNMATTYRGEVERERAVDLGDPRAAGWTYLVNARDPQRAQIEEILRPLAEWRGMADPDSPLVYRDQYAGAWGDWLEDNYCPYFTEPLPHYVLIIGGPDLVPFHFQSFLDSAASVGRVAFDSLDELEAYVAKLLRIEQAPSPIVTRDTLFFAPDGGLEDPTYFSRRYMAEPLADEVRRQLGFDTRVMMGDDATKAGLMASLGGTNPALVYTASHGMEAPRQPLQFQQQVNGAICCQHDPQEPMDQWLLTGDDIPSTEPFLEGAIFFQFACFGYGTPAESDFMHWLGNPQLNAAKSFVAALPKRLLAHPRGPIAFIGHVDTAWLHGFDDPESPHLLDRWHPRIAPFVRAIDMLLGVQPVGLAMADMNKRYDLGNALLTNTIDRLQRGTIAITPEFHSRLVNAFIMRTDAQNYMVFGDPAVSLRIPAP